MLGRQVRQVLRTYTSRKWFLLISAQWLFLRLVFSWAPIDNGTILIPQVMNLAMGWMIGQHLATQFIGPPARLFPRFGPAHLLVAGAIVATMVAIDGSIAWAGGISAWALASVSAATTAVGLLSALSTAWMVLTGVVFLVGSTSILWMPLDFLPIRLAGSGADMLLPFGLAAVIALLFAAFRLLTLSEETAGLMLLSYGRGATRDVMVFSPTDAWRLAAQRDARIRSRRWWGDAAFDFIMHRLPPEGPLRRLLFRQLTAGLWSLFWTPFLFLLMLVLFLASSNAPFSTAGSVGDATPLGLVAFYISSLPFLIAFTGTSTSLFRRWPHLSRELLLPLDRADFVRGVTHSTAVGMTLGAVGHCAGLVVGLAVFQPQSPLVEFVPLWIALTLVQYYLGSCVVLGVATYRSFPLLILASTAFVIVSASLIVAVLSAGDDFWTPAKVMLCIVVTASVVAGFHRLTINRWCHLELG